MKRFIMIVAAVLLLISSSAAQRDLYGPADTFAFVNIYLSNPDNSPYANSKVILQGTTKTYRRLEVQTDAKGFVRAKVPMGETYVLYCNGLEAFRKAKIGDFPFVTHELRGYTHRFIQFTFNYNNFEGKPIPAEAVKLVSIATGKEFFDTTNAKGKAVFWLPYEEKFDLSVKYHPSFKLLELKESGKEYKQASMTFTWIGAAEADYRSFLADSLAKDAELKAIAYMDSILNTGDLILSEDFHIPVTYHDSVWIQKAYEKKAKLLKQQLDKDPNYFEEHNLPVLAVLMRLNKKYPQKLIVTDITGSMYPYMEEVLLWHALNFSQNGARSKYLFFNDGDDKRDAQKVIGKTGGLYFCQGQFKDFNVILQTLRKGINGGSGGDAPENDLEALLAANQKKEPLEELILVADNNSLVRDISLLSSLKVPVRVIVCGAEIQHSCRFRWTEINADYLTIAYKTKGSVHTLKEDIYDLYQTPESGKIQLNGVEYILEQGKFIALRKL